MSSLNKSAYRQNARAMTPAGTVVRGISAEKQLVRMTLANMLWEDQFYVDGKKSAELIADLVKKVDAKFVSNLAIMARTQFKMRHIPLLLTRELARTSRLAADVLNTVIQRPDEMSEFLSIYWKEGKIPLANQVKKGLAKAMGKFNEYQLAKWDKNSAAVKLRDVLFLTHPKPVNKSQEDLFKRIANKQLATPDTWETELSGGANKAETFTRLMAEKKLGALAFLRNLRNMTDAGISDSVIRDYAKNVDVTKVLPFRYMAAASIMPRFEDMLEGMMLSSLESHEKLPGKTKLYVDVSSSMYTTKVSAKSDLTRRDAALALAILCREICEDIEIYSFSGKALRIAPRHGFALADAIRDSQGCSGTDLGKSLLETRSQCDRIIVITDEQSYDRVEGPAFGAKGYMINVAAYENGINHGAWLTISGFSEAVIDYIQATEKDVSL